MIKPVILVVDPEPEILWAVKDDLQQKYNGNFQLIRANSDTATLEKLRQLQKQNDLTTLFVVEQQSSQMTGAEFLNLVIKMFPKAKQFLLKIHDTDDVPCYLPLLKAVIV